MNLDNLSKSSLSLINECPVECRNAILKVALSVNSQMNQPFFKSLDRISNDFSISNTKVTEVLGVYLLLIRLFLGMSDKEFKSKLNTVGFSDEFINEFPLFNNRIKVYDTVLQASCPNKLASLKWRIDISLTKSALNKRIPTSVILCLTFKNDRKYTINVNITEFRKLRYNVALILKELTDFKLNQINK